jgi:hypothetical protein
VLDVFDSCGIWLVSFLCACLMLMVIAFSHSMITHEAFVRFDGLLDYFLCGMGRVRGHVSRVSLLVHDFVLMMLLLVLLMLVL